MIERATVATALVCRVHVSLCALPLEHVIESMRPLPITPIATGGDPTPVAAPHAVIPDFVLGIAMIRGEPTPVIDVARLLGAARGLAGRFVLVRCAQRRIALAVDSVIGVRALMRDALLELPPLLSRGEPDAHVISALGALDAELPLVLRTARLMPSEVWTHLDAPAHRA